MFVSLVVVLVVGASDASSPGGVFEVTDDSYTTGKDTVVLKVGKVGSPQSGLVSVMTARATPLVGSLWWCGGASGSDHAVLKRWLQPRPGLPSACITHGVVALG